MKLTIDGNTVIIQDRFISMNNRDMFSATYKGCMIDIWKGKGDEKYYAQVSAPDGCYIVDGFGNEDITETIKWCVSIINS